MAVEQQGTGVQVLQLEPQAFFCIRETVPVANLGEAMGARLGVIRGYLQQGNAKVAGPPFVRYHTFGDTETDFELGIPVAEPVESEGRITTGELPGGPAVTTWHVGAHDKLGEAYARIQAFIEQHGYEASGPAWEVYYWLDPNQEADPTNWDPSTWRTQLVQPLK
ncbi:MAG: GyrI-like domain-containing protein [Chloroflexota bacterium]|nr:GyrI-like domain-containing protein [Chloroflexota bacterium]